MAIMVNHYDQLGVLRLKARRAVFSLSQYERLYRAVDEALKPAAWEWDKKKEASSRIASPKTKTNNYY